MRQLTLTIPDSFYDSLMLFLKPIPDVYIDENRQRKVTKEQQDMVLERVKNAKPEDYIFLEDALKELDKKWL